MASLAYPRKFKHSVIRFLLNWGFNVNAKDEYERTGFLSQALFWITTKT